ncbi:MAG: hypothetical protein KGL93_09230, partial [Gemmatimonadota bacterium]|nr:hypothetical protein [Gemmatimonadota bacterium]
CVGWHPAWRTRLPWGARLAAPLAGAAAVGALGAIALGGRLSGRGVAVVRGDAMLRDDPAFGTDRGPTVVTGEMVRVLRQEGAWERVQLDGGRQGWMPAEGLVAVDAPLSSSLD